LSNWPQAWPQKWTGHSLPSSEWQNQFAPRKRDFSAGPQDLRSFERDRFVQVKCPLPSLRVEALTELSLAVEQSDSHHRNSEVAGRLHLVARHVAESANRFRVMDTGLVQRIDS
jgi:hypothetical protein